MNFLGLFYMLFSAWNFMNKQSDTETENKLAQMRARDNSFYQQYLKEQYDETVQRNSLQGQMADWTAAGMNANFFGGHSISTPSWTGVPQNDQSLPYQSAGSFLSEFLSNQLMQSYYSALMTKEDYLLKKQNRQTSETRENLNRILTEIQQINEEKLSYDSPLRDFYSTAITNFVHSLWKSEEIIDKEGKPTGKYRYVYTDAGKDFYQLIIDELQEKMKQQGYRNTILVDQSELNERKLELTEQQTEKLKAELQRLNQLIEKGNFDNSDLMRAFQIILSVIKIFK